MTGSTELQEPKSKTSRENLGSEAFLARAIAHTMPHRTRAETAQSFGTKEPDLARSGPALIRVAREFVFPRKQLKLKSYHGSVGAR